MVPGLGTAQAARTPASPYALVSAHRLTEWWLRGQRGLHDERRRFGQTTSRIIRTPTTASRLVARQDTDRLAQFWFNSSDPEIFSMAADGSDRRDLSNDPAVLRPRPDWSPDGSLIASARAGAGDYVIWVMYADGTNQTQLTFDAGFDGIRRGRRTERRSPSPRAGRRGTGDIFAMNADGSGETNLTNDSSTDDYAPTWSSDGVHIAFTRDGEIYSMDAGGGNLVEPHEQRGFDFGPAWSHDGTKIGLRPDGTGLDDVWSMNAIGTGQMDLTNDSTSDDSWPTWSTDGARLAYARLVPPPPPPDFEIWTMNADGSGQFALTATPPMTSLPPGRPAGRRSPLRGPIRPARLRDGCGRQR